MNIPLIWKQGNTFALKENAKKLVNSYYANRLLQFKVTYETECERHEVGHEAEALLAKILISQNIKL